MPTHQQTVRGPRHVELSGWGRTAPSVAEVDEVTTDARIAERVRDAGPRGVLARGLGRSYGDAAQNGGGVVLDMTGRRAVVSVDQATGVVEAQAGVSIDQLIRELLVHGWFVPVTPGTRQVTVGGAIASDV
ncbi:MAG: FAD-binding protein, partial [Propionibacterium sp.]|nr:FAD-binding protein [Propionibacterium sp.]